jgi:hypothetical protein
MKQNISNNIINEHKSMDESKCQTVIWNLIELFDVPKYALPSSILVSELMQTKRCDDIFEKSVSLKLKALRNDYTQTIIHVWLNWNHIYY